MMRHAGDAPASTASRGLRTAPAREFSGKRNALWAGSSSLHRALHAEWTKLRTLPGTPWLPAAVVALTVAVSSAAAAAVTCPAGGCSVDPARTSLTGIYLGQAVAAILGVLVISSEFSTGVIRTTFTAMPRRATVLAAKAAIISGLVLAAGAIAVAGSLLAGSLLAGRVLLTGHGFTPAHGYPALTLGDGPVLRAAVGSVLYLALIALLSRRRHHRSRSGASYRHRARHALVYLGSAEVRYHERTATTRVTMKLDPSLSADDVAGIYGRLRQRFHPAPLPRYQSARRCQLAAHVGPHLQIRTGEPRSRPGPGRPPSPGPAGLATFIEALPGHSWSSLRHS